MLGMLPYTSSRVFLCYTQCQPDGAAENCGCRVPVRGVPAVSQLTDLSSVPIDKAQHHRAPEISQQRDKKQKTHTVR